MALPDGWTREKSLYGNDTEAIFRPQQIGGGIVSIDYERRNFAGGYGSTHRPASTKKYFGRGWREALEADAVAWLESVMGANVELTGAAAGLSPQRPATEGSEVERRVGGGEL